jgi:hypothetical protein
LCGTRENQKACRAMHPPSPSATSDREAAAREGGDADSDPVEGVNEGVNEGVKILLAAIIFLMGKSRWAR